MKVNGKAATIGDSASREDTITVDGKEIEFEHHVYFVMNKPKGYVTTVKESHGMKTIMELANIKERVYPVGRLDKNSEGLLILTNDGELTNRLTHPRFGVEKEYIVEVDKPIVKTTTKKLQEGTEIDGREVRVSELSVKGKRARLRIHEGRKHIIRRLFKKLGYTVRSLVRTKIGPLSLGSLARGKIRRLSEKEVKKLKSFINKQ